MRTETSCRSAASEVRAGLSSLAGLAEQQNKASQADSTLHMTRGDERFGQSWETSGLRREDRMKIVTRWLSEKLRTTFLHAAY